MTSPLLDYANGWLLIGVGSTPSIVNGRVVQGAESYRVVECYLKRQQSTGTSTGADYILSQTQSNLKTGSAGGMAFLYRGYALRYATLATKPNFETLNVDTLTYTQVDLVNGVPWMIAGVTGDHRQGADKPAYFAIVS